MYVYIFIIEIQKNQNFVQFIKDMKVLAKNRLEL